MVKKLTLAIVCTALLFMPPAVSAEQNDGDGGDNAERPMSEDELKLQGLINALTQVGETQQISATNVRDPFSYDVPDQNNPTPNPTPTPTPPTPQPNPTPQPPTPPEQDAVEHWKKEAAQATAKITELMLTGSHTEAIQHAEKNLQAWEEDPEVLGWLDREHHEVLRLKRAAERLRRHDEIQKGFDAFPLKIEGIAWGPKRAVATINGHVVREGDIVLERGEDPNQVRNADGKNAEGQDGATYSARPSVYRIDKEHVIFVYRGLKMRKKSEGARDDSVHTAAK